MYAVVVSEESWATGKSVTRIAKHKSFPREAILAGIYRIGNKAFVVPRGDTELEAGDTVYIVTPSSNIKIIADILSSPKGRRSDEKT